MERVQAIEEDVVTLPDRRLDPTRANIVRARRVTVSQTVKLAGQSIALYASVVEFSPDGMIDTSGSAGNGYEPGKAKDGQVPGANGGDGESGTSGQDGGSIRIVAERIVGPIWVRTNGGFGGRGRDGGNGYRGRDGNPAGQRLVIAPENKGEPGQRGGDGGQPGASGDGGSGGDVDISVIDPSSYADVQRRLSVLPVQQTAGGLGGLAAKGGKGGDGGKGGAGGPHGRVVVRGAGPEREHVTVTDGVSQKAPDGAAGATRANGKAGNDGQSGTVTIRQILSKDYLKTATAAHLNRLLRDGEQRYRNSEFTAAAEILGYVQRVAEALVKKP